jgi:AAA15 family ATPase/GTPase
MLRAIQSDNFPPFRKFDLKLPPVGPPSENLAEVHLFTGVNGTGKTRLLSALASMLGNNEPLMKRVKGMEGSILIKIAGDSHDPPANWLGGFVVQSVSVGWQALPQ